LKSLVVFDTNYGNTKLIAENICKELGGDCRLAHVRGFDISDLEGLDLLIVGCPIRGWRPTERISNMLRGLRPGSLKGISVSSFDTRMKMVLSGDAAKKILKGLKGAGARVAGDPAFFLVKAKEGPLFDGEVQRAIDWAKSLQKIF
jgi:flavodoxin